MMRLSAILFTLFPLLLAGCAPQKTVSYATLLEELTNLKAIARLDVPATEMICSYDRTGANEDYNHFQGKTSDGQCNDGLRFSSRRRICIGKYL